MKKVGVYCITILFVVIFCKYNVYASSTDYIDSIEQELENSAVDGPEIVFVLDGNRVKTLTKGKDGTYTGYQLVRTSGAWAPTMFRCTLSPGAGGIDTLHHIILSWSGGNQVNFIHADSLMVRKSSLTGTKIYFNKPINKPGGSKTSGSITVGTVTIPKTVKRVYVTTKNLQCYFNDRDYWIRLNEIKGWADTNW